MVRSANAEYISKQGYMIRYMCSSSICDRLLKSLAAVTPLQRIASTADPTVNAPLLERQSNLRTCIASL